MVEVDLVQAIGTLGFPIAISIYLLWERGKHTKDLTRAIYELGNLLKIIEGKMTEVDQEAIE